MADVTPAREDIQTEDVAYRSAVSEAVANKLAASINFHNAYQHYSKVWDLNGKYSSVAGAQTAVDGAYGVLFDCDIIGVMMWNLVAGSGGTTTLDVNRWTASNTGGTSIFSTRPAIASTAGNYAFVFYDVANATTLENPSGTTLPVLSVTQLNKGDMLTLDIDAKQTDGQSCGLMLFFRPR